MIEISKDLVFIPQRGLYQRTEEGERCITSSDGYVTPLFVMALQGKLAERCEPLLRSKEWEQLLVNTTFVSYQQLYHYVALMENEVVRKTMPNEQNEALDTLVRIYLRWVIEREDAIVRDKPSVWFEPAFYPAGVYAESEDFDPYSRYDSIPFGGFARVAFYFFIANTAKNVIKEALQAEDLLGAGQAAIKTCIAIFDDRDNVKLQHGMLRRLLEHYMEWRYEQTDIRLGNNVALCEDDLWQEIFDEESRAYTLFNDNMDKQRLYSLRPLLELQGDLLKRMQKDHPFITTTGKRINPNNLPKEGSYVGLVEWLEAERSNGRDYLEDYDNNVEAMCNDMLFKKKIGWYKIDASNLRRTMNRKGFQK